MDLDELRARVARLEQENARLREELSPRGRALRLLERWQAQRALVGMARDSADWAFTVTAVENYYRAIDECAYPANYYIRALRQKGGVTYAKELLARARSYGLERLAALGRLDLSTEAQVVQPAFAWLFTPAERAVAHRRLATAPKAKETDR